MVTDEGGSRGRGQARTKTREQVALQTSYLLCMEEKKGRDPSLVTEEDVDLKNPDQSLKQTNKVEASSGSDTISADPEKFGITISAEDVEANHPKAAPEKMQLTLRSLWEVCKIFQSYPFTPCLVLVLAISPIGLAYATSLNETNQMLPRECLSWLRDHSNDCPQRGHPFDNAWDTLNALCCREPGTVLQCQTHNQFSIAACLPDQPVPAGHRSILVTDIMKNPKIKLKKCANDSFSSAATNSSFNRFPYCELKSMCNSEGEELRCLGGITQNDHCGCQVGYHPNPATPLCLSLRGFDTARDECHCIPLDCPDGNKASTNLSLPSPFPACSNLPDVSVGSWCAPPPVPPDPTSVNTPDNRSTTSASTDFTTSTTVAPTIKPDVKDNQKTDVALIIGVLVLAHVMCLTAGLLFKYRQKFVTAFKYRVPQNRRAEEAEGPDQTEFISLSDTNGEEMESEV